MAARKSHLTTMAFIKGSSEMHSACLVKSFAASSYLLDMASAMASSIFRLSERLVSSEQRQESKTLELPVIGLFKCIDSKANGFDPPVN